MEFLDHLRKKPQHVRARFALGTSLGITLLVAVIWSTTLPARFGGMGEILEENGVSQVGAVQESFDSIIGNISAGVMETPPEEEVVEDPEVAALRIDSMEGLNGWEMATTSPNMQQEAFASSQVETSPPTPSSTASTRSETPTPQVILIGTTTKKTE